MVILLILSDITIMTLINIGYLKLVAMSDVSSDTKRFVQFALAAVKTLCNVVVVESVKVIMGITPQLVKDTNRAVLLCVSLILFNSIVVPCVVTAMTDSHCFLYVYKEESSVTVDYIVPTFFVGYNYNDDLTLTKVYDSKTFSTSFTPPFLYSYQCGSALIRNYVPVYFYATLMSGVVKPLVFLAAVQVRFARVPRLVVDALPGIIWPTTTSKKGQSFFPVPSIVASFANHVAVLVTFGFLCPPLAVCIALAVFAEGTMWKLLMERCTMVLRDTNALGQVCDCRCFTGVYSVILLMWAILSTLVLYDMVAGGSGVVSAVWVPCIVGFTAIMPIVVAVLHSYPKRHLLEPEVEDEEATATQDVQAPAVIQQTNVPEETDSSHEQPDSVAAATFASLQSSLNLLQEQRAR
jgi:hypothetical protein